MRKWILALGLCIATGAFAKVEETLKWKTSRGDKLDVVVTYPTEKFKGAVLVLAPGQGYHMARPIIQQLADKANAAGLATVRFNWRYFSADAEHGQPSGDLKNESEDLMTVLRHVKTDARIDASQIIVAGKSLGSLVSYDVFKHDPSIKGLVLMTPVCTETTDDKDRPLPKPVNVGVRNYPGLTDVDRPVVVALGHADDLCSVNMLYDFVRTAKVAIPVVVVPGNHSWDVGSYKDSAFTQKNAQNVDAATSLVIHWVSVMLGR